MSADIMRSPAACCFIRIRTLITEIVKKKRKKKTLLCHEASAPRNSEVSLYTYVHTSLSVVCHVEMIDLIYFHTVTFPVECSFTSNMKY